MNFRYCIVGCSSEGILLWRWYSIYLGIVLFAFVLKAYCRWELAQHSSIVLFAVLLPKGGC